MASFSAGRFGGVLLDDDYRACRNQGQGTIA